MVPLSLPTVTNSEEAVEAASMIIDRVGDGVLTASEGARCLGLLESFIRVHECSVLEKRIAALEVNMEKRR